jgi:membrane associated rhomboid family serine protease
MSMTLIIIIVTSVFSIIGFYQPGMMHRFNFNPFSIYHRKQYYRLFTHAFLHADWIHLFINMFVLYSFGNELDYWMHRYFGPGKGTSYFLTLYFGGILLSTLYGLIKNRDNYNYNAVGASGAVSSVVFACIFFAPMQKLLLFAVLPVRGIFFGILYLGYSWYMSRKATENIAHDVHFWGAIFGFLFPLVLDYRLYQAFIYQLSNY